ncbi:hypothetical protein GGR28_002935 [Lewinella aquimaris]|uniref:Secretion system C-terminal sorting domain-containing protein n=1 Tax=Neolewinella aquimaris TaxID=1835722 RepID=A0A840E9S7_9BACT|nr:T9SS type A sorting domain-containing protein [Neolewinella aquimaris]MBB4080305.1 hypothetical protein [Neolewinella aquimaris]
MITWEKGTDTPDDLYSHQIRQDGRLIRTQIGFVRSCLIAGLNPNEKHTYTVSTYYNRGGNEYTAPSNPVQGATFSPTFTASDGTNYNATVLKWNNMAGIAQELLVERATPGGQREELAVLSSISQGYTDTEGVPGYEYMYYLTPIGSTFGEQSDAGYSRPNGVIKGYVRSSLGTGVPGVTVKVDVDGALTPSGATLPPGCPGPTAYCATTDITGYYEVRDIYYHEEASFTITPEKLATTPHRFAPATSRRTLDVTANIAPGVDFNDLSVFTIQGRVHYPIVTAGDTCGISDVKILVDDNDVGIRTNGNGYWSHVLQDIDDYSFTPEFSHHTFIATDGRFDPSQVQVSDHVSDLNFTDTTTDSLRIVVQGGCGVSLGDSIEVEIRTSNNCYQETVVLDESGVGVISDLPAREYQVKVADIFGVVAGFQKFDILDQIGVERITVDLTVRDTADVITVYDSMIITPQVTTLAPNNTIIEVTPADTIFAGTLDTVRRSVDPEARFIYRSPLIISTDFAQAGATIVNCTNTGDVIVMEQGLSYTIQIDVAETLGSDCPINTGSLKIYDFISDRGAKPTILPIRNGIVNYTINAGAPNLATSADHSYEKLLFIIPEVDQLSPEPVSYWAVVEGVKTPKGSLISRTPEIPMLILHDPPGDNSYSYVEAGTSFTNFTRTEMLTGSDEGFYTNTVVGTAAKIFMVEFAAGVQLQLDIQTGRDEFNRTGTEATVTFLDRFSTSDLDNLTGGDGDVYIGAAYNQEYSIAQELKFKNCAGQITDVPAINVESFATTFVYTELHIKNVLLPTLGRLRAGIINNRIPSDMTEDEKIEANLLLADSLSWENILAKNDTARTEGVFVENVTFSAGASVSREKTESNSASTSYEYNAFMNTDFAVGIKGQFKGLGLWIETETGGFGSFRSYTSVDEGASNDTTRTVGYVFDDGDIGDFFSVDILTDESYDVPAFRLRAGTSSCPQEVNTQARDRPKIGITPPKKISGIPADGTATFVCSVTNNSESGETREYHVRTVSTTNPDGAQLILGGQRINNGPATFFLPAGETIELTLAVKRGPLASNYQDIGVMVYPPCEYELWQDNGSLVNADTAYITQLNFATECSDVTLREPFNGWIINRNSGDSLSTTFSGYDRNNDSLENLVIELKPEGKGYREIYVVPAADLTSANYSFDLNLRKFPDGAYTLRAVASCGRNGVTYSSEKHGIIDRRSLAPFGYPSPSDGFLRPGQDISVSFDKTINCTFPTGDYQPEYSLTRSDTDTEIAVTLECSGQTIILRPDTPLTDMPDLAGVEVTARLNKLRDPSGNEQKYATVWSFRVNTVPVFWEPSPIYYSGFAGLEHVVTGVLKNDSDLSKPYSFDLQDVSGLVSYPDWLTPLQINGTILANNTEEVSFAVDPELTPGIYSGTIDALVDGEVVSTDVTVELLAIPVNWPFSPDNYEYDMTIVAQFSLDGSDTLLSTDDRDLVGAFVNGEIRGVAQVEYIPSSNSYAAYLKVYSNTLGGGQADEITFRFWHALNGVEYGAMESLTFRADDHVGSASQPYILHPEGIFQVIPLNQGWNWISLNVASADMSRESVFESILGSTAGNDIIVKTQSQSAQYSPGSGWSSNLRDIELGQGYLLHLSIAPDTLKVVGLPSPTPVAFGIENRWNWIGYPRINPEPVNDVLQDLLPGDGDILKGKSGFSLFEAASGEWTGNLTQFMPGAGYKLQSSRKGTITHPAQKTFGYEVERGRFEQNMNVTGVFDAELLGETDYTQLEVIALVNGECRGIGQLEYCSSEADYRAFVLVSGNVADYGQPLEFRILNKETGTEYPTNGEEQAFGADYIVGSVSNPYAFLQNTTPVVGSSLYAYVLGANRPNPATGRTLIPFSIPQEQAVLLEIYDVNGRLIRTLADRSFMAGDHLVPVELTGLSAGVYLYRMQTDGFEQSRRMIVR